MLAFSYVKREQVEPLYIQLCTSFLALYFSHFLVITAISVGFSPLSYTFIEGSSGPNNVFIVITNNVSVGAGVSKQVTINSVVNEGTTLPKTGT